MVYEVQAGTLIFLTGAYTGNGCASPLPCRLIFHQLCTVN